MFAIKTLGLSTFGNNLFSISQRVIYSKRSFSTASSSARQLEQVKRVSKIAKNMNKIDFFHEPRLEKRALQLIFGDRKYNKFSSKEKKLVDAYQDYVQQESNMIMPNTASAEDCKKVRQLYSHMFFNENNCKKPK